MSVMAFSIIPLVLLIGVLGFVFWIIMLVDAASRKFKEDTEKIVWILVIVLTGGIGALIYYFMVYWKDKTKSMRWFWVTLIVLVVLILLLFLLTLVTNTLV